MTNNTGQKTVLGSNPYLILNNRGQVLPPLELTANQHILGRDRTTADLTVPDDWRVVSSGHARLQKEGNDYRIYDGVVDKDGKIKPSSNGSFVNHTRIAPSDGYLLQNGVEVQIGQNPENLISVTYINPTSSKQFAQTKHSAISLQQRSILLGRDANSALPLDSPTVSRRHATIDTDAQGRYILQDFSTNGVFVNGQKVNGTTILPDGATIRIGPFILVRRGHELEVLDQGDQIRLDAHELVIPKRLDKVTVAIEPGQFVALVGGSGAGKSTLMKTLLGIEKIAGGTVYLNGENLQNNFNIYRTQIGYVPQDDIVHADLTVTEVLSYAAKLRLPPDTDIAIAIRKTLDDIGMSHKRDTLVRELSGGQRKRVSIGVELLADPKLFFLDEPTSGLDPGRDKKMMLLLRELANQGKTVILVTHATANISMCDRVAFLGRNGRLCYFGVPEEAFQFFGLTSNDFADIYIKLEPEDEKETEAIAQSEAARFSMSDYYRRYVRDRLSLPGAYVLQTGSLSPAQAKPSLWQQLSLLAQRNLQLMWRDQINLRLALLTAPIGIGLIPLAIRNKDPLFGQPEATLAPLALRVLFVFTCAALWVGLSSSVQEIIKESAIYFRERLVNLGLFSYLGSKLLILSGLALLQTILISVVILIGFKSPEPQLISWQLGLAITTFLTLLTSISLGLMVSSLVKNSSQANSTLPLLLLPQIIFSGVLFKMEGVASKISWLMLSRWSIGAYGSLVNVNAMVPKPAQLPDGSLMTLPFEKTPVYDATWENLGLNWGVLLLHTAIYLGVTFWAQKRKDIF